MITRALLLVALLAIAAFQPCRAEGHFAGRNVEAILEELRESGLPLVYSSELVTPELANKREPTSSDPLEIAQQILAPHGLTLRRQGAVYVVTRASAAEPDAPSPGTGESGAGTQAAGEDGPRELEPIRVSTSRYVLQAASQFFVDQRAIQSLPDLGEDPLRSVHRLPGTAASGLSARAYFRGGDLDETAIYLNGLQLLDPFHIRDYHSIFSSIDARAISGVEAFTGGFPVPYGDHMSGILSLESRRPEQSSQTELGLSFYSTSILHSGFSEDGEWDWLISARDSNLDVILDEDLGQPDYFDIFAQIGRQISDSSYISFNALYADDSVVVITENQPEELERSDSDTSNRQFWFRLETDWQADLSSATVLSYSNLDNLRVAEMNDPDRQIAKAFDKRKAKVWALRSDWRWTAWPSHDLRWGLEYKEQSADFHYRGDAEYVGFLGGLPELENPRVHQVDASPDGHGATIYLRDQWRLAERTWLNYGLRWDSQTWTDPRFDDQISPRISVLHRLNDKTDLRLTWGRYYQSQAIHRLQVEDGIDHYFEPQRSDHYIAGIQRFFGSGYRLRAEAFVKQYSDLKPRFENLFDPLALIPEMAPDRILLQPSSADARGIELSLEYRKGDELSWWVSYVLSRATDRINGENQPRSWDQRHALQAGISWSRGPWEIGAAINAHTGWPTTPLTATYDADEDEYIPVPGPRNSDQFKTFMTFDFRVSRDIEVRKGRLNVFLEVSNATNRDNPCCVDWDIEDETDPAMIDRSLDYWVPIIPAIGLLWEF